MNRFTEAWTKGTEKFSKDVLGPVVNPALNVGMVSIWYLCKLMLTLATGVKVGG